MLESVKLAIRIASDAYDDEITALIEAAYADLGITGTDTDVLADDALVVQAVKTYCKMNFLSASDNEYDRLKKSYDEQKAQLQSASGYGL